MNVCFGVYGVVGFDEMWNIGDVDFNFKVVIR